jgi:hypothetical protein
MKEPIPDRLAAAHAIAQELKVDPEHPGTLRLAAALGDAPPAESPVTPPLADAGAAISQTQCPDENDPPPLVPVFPRLHNPARHEPAAGD